MSHELRTPLNAVIGFSQLIDRETSMEDILEFVEHIHKGGYHLLGIIEDILNISVIESGKVELNKENHSLNAILEEIDRLIKKEQIKIQKPDITMLFTPLEKDPDPLIFTDCEKLKQVLMNLVRNALKFTEEGSIEYGVQQEVKDDITFLKFFVRDTGIGIPQNMQQIIFDLFRQADESHTRTHGGTGIGLSIARKLVELLGGTIWVESEVGLGSTFYFTIPMEVKKPVEQAEPPAKPAGMMKYPGKTVLVAEDEESNFELLDILVSAMELSILWARNGQEAVELYTENPHIDLVLMDLKMPVMDGFEATQLIREANPQLPILAQTAYAMPADREAAITEGCNDLLTKPIRKADLYQMIDKYMHETITEN